MALSKEEKRDRSRSQRHFDAVTGWGPGLRIENKSLNISREDLIDPQKFHQFAAAVTARNEEALEVLAGLDQTARNDLAKMHGNTPLTRFLR